MSPTSSASAYSSDLELGLRLADLADSISMARYQALDLVIETKPDATPVTDADKATEQAIRDLLAKERPNDLIVGEEFGTPDLTGKERYWVIDPIDGTKNFLRGVPTWATLIALVEGNGEVVVGVVSSPALFRRWYASKGDGAFVSLNHAAAQRISVSAVKSISDSSISYSDLEGWGERRAPFLELQQNIWRTRGLGDFWSHMLVAEGAVDLAVEPKLALWDMAALDIVVREAGGTFTNIDGVDGPHGGSAISSNGHIHHQFINALK
ncbi:MAG: inositol monophosphatase family protein [Actinomycetes bacterium]